MPCSYALPAGPNGTSKGVFGAKPSNADASRPSTLVSIEWITPYQASAAARERLDGDTEAGFTIDFTHKDLTLLVDAANATMCRWRSAGSSAIPS